MSQKMTSWAEQLALEMRERGESFGDIVSSTLSDAGLHEKFYGGYGGTNGEPFTVWTASTVYFPVCYDGAEWVGSVSRNPDGKPTDHQGGG